MGLGNDSWGWSISWWVKASTRPSISKAILILFLQSIFASTERAESWICGQTWLQLGICTVSMLQRGSLRKDFACRKYVHSSRRAQPKGWWKSVCWCHRQNCWRWEHLLILLILGALLSEAVQFWKCSSKNSALQSLIQYLPHTRLKRDEIFRL